MTFPPLNPDATPAGQELLERISSISGSRILFGQHNTPRELSFHSDQAHEIIGTYPAIC